MKRVSILMGLVVSIASSHAAQIKTVNNYDDITIKASITEPNSIMLDGDRISQIKAAGNTLVDACNGKASCKLIDEVTGTLTFMPSPLYHTRPFTINLMTEKGNFYNVHVEPKPISSQTILLKPYLKTVIRAHVPKTSGYEKVMVGFLRALVNGYVPEGFTQSIPKKAVIYKAPRTQLKLLLTVSGHHLCGEIFELSNLTNKPLKVREKWFNWPATKGVAVDDVLLAPFGKTRVYRIS